MRTAKSADKEVTITAPNFQIAQFTIRGTAPYVSNAFSKASMAEIRAKQAEGSTAGQSKRKRSAKDFDACSHDSRHETTDGRCGIPATAFRAALIRACALVGLEMTRAKMCVFIIADEYDDGTPLVLFTKGEPQHFETAVRNATGVMDIRARSRWDIGWEVKLRIQYDADLLTVTTLANLILRAGMQVGVGAGRPFSKESNGMGWGTFEIVQD